MPRSSTRADPLISAGNLSELPEPPLFVVTKSNSVLVASLARKFARRGGKGLATGQSLPQRNLN
jgi:hypothetical protein